MAGELYFAERGGGPALLLIHGALVDGEMFNTIVDVFARRRRVIVPDLRGAGRSRSLPPPDTAAVQANDLATLLDKLGVDRADVLGYSHGGAVAQQFAVDHADRCRRLALICTYAQNTATTREWIEAQVALLLLRTLGMRQFANLIAGLGMKHLAPGLAASVKRMMARQDLGRMIMAWKELIAFDGRPRLNRIACPTLIVAGSADNGVPMHHARELEAGIAGSRLVVIEGGDHALV